MKLYIQVLISKREFFMRPSRFRICLGLLAAFTAICLAATKSTILGTVHDASGAVVANATVTVTNELTSFSREISTNEDGDYDATNLDPGMYTVSAQAAGFKRFIRNGVELRVDQRLRVDVNLAVGEVTEQIQVTGQAPLVESDTSSIGQVIDREKVNRLPLNGRFFLQLALLSPGANLGGVSTRQSANQEGNSLSINGMRSYSNTYLVDGVDNNALLNGYYVVSPSVDSIQEFKVQMNAYSAEFGRSAGAQVNVVTRTGTNQVHGSAYEYLRNDTLDANPWFSNAGGITAKVPFKRNQFGASFGGPIYIPKLYNGKNRTFFFFNYEGTRIRQAVNRVSSVPTAPMKLGDFAGMATIYDPLNAPGGQRQPFPGNRIPDSRISSTSKFLQDFVPLPNGPGLAGNFTRNAAYKDDTDQYGFRLDQKVGSKGQLFARVFYYPRAVTNPSNFGTPAIGAGGFGSGVIETDGRHLYGIGYTHVFRPNLINDFRAGYNRFVWLYYHDNIGHDISREAGIQGLPTDSDLVGFPIIGITALTGWGDASFVPNITNPASTIHATNSTTWIKGNHTFKGGIDFRFADQFFLTGGSFRGNFSFNGRYTAATALGVGTPYADYLLGYTSGASRTVGTETAYTQFRNYHFYFQDDWKVNRRLTLYLGLRYEWNPPFFAKDDRIANFDLNTGSMVYADMRFVPPGLPFPTAQAVTRSTIYGDKNGWGPRLGFAYRLTDDNKTALRGGYGIYINQETGNPQGNLSLTNPPFQFTSNITPDPVTPDIRYETAFASSPRFGGTPGVTMFEWNNKNAYMLHWSLSLQRDIAGNLFEVAYGGSKGTRVIGVNNVNQPLPGPGAIQARRPFPLYSGIGYYGPISSSIYHSFQFKSERRLSKGVTYLASYAWSRSIDNASEVFSSSPNPQNYGSYMRGLSNYDQTHRFTLSGLWELPFGKDRSFMSGAHPVTNAILGGWNLGGILTLATGFPYTVSIPVDRANIGTGGQRPDVVGDWRVPSPSIQQWFNPAAFALPAEFTFGNAGRNILRGPGFKSLDASIAKRFFTFERQFLEFRCELFNATNTPNFALPSATINTATAGRIFGVASPARQIQFALRYEF
jgi:hypothetical protein